MDIADETHCSCHSAKFSIYTTEECFKPWMNFLHHVERFIRGESNPRYDQTVLTITKKYGIDAAYVHTTKFVSKK